MGWTFDCIPVVWLLRRVPRSPGQAAPPADLHATTPRCADASCSTYAGASEPVWTWVGASTRLVPTLTTSSHTRARTWALERNRRSITIQAYEQAYRPVNPVPTRGPAVASPGDPATGNRPSSRHVVDVARSACVVNGRLRQEGESRGGAGAYQKGEKTFRPGIKGLGDGNGITPNVFTMFFHKNDCWDSHRRTRNSPAHGIA